jgi:prepilin-type N-terminal cleavage/methylation domain-containing protein
MNRSCSNSGFSLVESMVALLILAIGMAGVGTLLQESMVSDVNSASMRRMDEIAREIVEDLKGQLAQLRFDEIADNVSLKNPDFGAPAYQNAGQVGSVNFVDRRGVTGAGYVYKWRVEDKNSSWSTPLSVTTLYVTVAWDVARPAVSPAPIWPNTGSDPDDPNRWRYKVKICNFILPR